MRLALLALCLALAGACDGLPGRPRRADRPIRPSDVTDFATLYGANCAGCHGDERRPGAAVALADPVYMALVDDATLRRVIATGVPDTAMPGFAQSAGGALTDAQLDALVRGMRTLWARADALAGATPPSWAAAPGDPGGGRRAYAARCASCHGTDGTGGNRGGSVVDGSYLALVSNQGLRTTVLVGRPTRGMPDWRGAKAGAPMTAQEIADVVAWLVAQRPALPGQPYPSEGSGG